MSRIKSNTGRSLYRKSALKTVLLLTILLSLVMTNVFIPAPVRADADFSIAMAIGNVDVDTVHVREAYFPFSVIFSGGWSNVITLEATISDLAGAAVLIHPETITPPSMRDFDRLIKKAREQAKLAGMTRSDISRAIAEVRKEQ